jgi:hypothetical protein
MTTIYIIIDDNIKNVAIEYALSIKNKLQAQIINISTNEYYIIKSFNNLSKYIFFGIKYTSYIRYYERDNLNSSNVFFVNLEPLTCNGFYSKYNFLEEVLMFHANYPFIKLLDYSQENIIILKSYNIYSTYLPYQCNYNEIINCEINHNIVNKTWDVVTCCSWCPRIENIFNNIPIYYNKFSIGNPALWGIDRDNILFNSKIIINIHHRENDYKILEELRVTRCILNKIIVISEESIFPNIYPLSKYVIFVDYNNINEKVNDVLNNYEKYYNEIYKNFDVSNIDTLLTNYIENTI